MRDSKLKAPTNSSVNVLGQGCGEPAHHRVGRLKRPSKAALPTWSRSWDKVGIPERLTPRQSNLPRKMPRPVGGAFFAFRFPSCTAATRTEPVD